MADIICPTCDARGETPGTCECVVHVEVGQARRPAMGSRDACEACGEEMHGLYASCIADRVQMSDEDEYVMSPVAAGAFRDALYRDEALRTLAANLAVAGALCESFAVGYGEGWDMAVRYGERAEWLPQSEYLHTQTIGDDDAHDWRPGCGRAWGGGA